MAAPTYVAKKVGDQYVIVPKNPAATRDGSMCLIGGAFLTAVGLHKRGVVGLALAAVGGSAIYHGMTGRNPWRKVMNAVAQACPQCMGRQDRTQTPSFQNDAMPARQVPEDDVDEASMESFPASDPPARHAVTTI